MVERRPSQWLILLDLAIKIFDHFEKTVGSMPHWSFGGGTALMLQTDHRESHDIDIFIHDPQILLFATPRYRGGR